jgi:hypothetical protein
VWLWLVARKGNKNKQTREINKERPTTDTKGLRCPLRATAPRGSCLCRWGGRRLCSAPVCVLPNPNLPGGLVRRAAWVRCPIPGVRHSWRQAFLASGRAADGGERGERRARGGGGGGGGGNGNFYPPGCYLLRRDGMSRHGVLGISDRLILHNPLARSSNEACLPHQWWRHSTAGTDSGTAAGATHRDPQLSRYHPQEIRRFSCCLAR